MIQRWVAWATVESVVFASLFALLLVGCGVETGPSVELKPAAASDVEAVSGSAGTAKEGESVGESPGAAVEGTSDSLPPQLGFVQDGKATVLENGGRVPLGENKVAEVFLSPYPPDWQTDLHLFIMDKETFMPLSDVDVDLVYDMVYMDHGIDAQTGTKVAEGHYILPLSFLMYGDWSVDTTVQLPEGKKHLRFIIKFFP